MLSVTNKPFTPLKRSVYKMTGRRKDKLVKWFGTITIIPVQVILPVSSERGLSSNLWEWRRTLPLQATNAEQNKKKYLNSRIDCFARVNNFISLFQRGRRYNLLGRILALPSKGQWSMVVARLVEQATRDLKGKGSNLAATDTEKTKQMEIKCF